MRSKLKNLPATVAFISLLVGFSFVVYLRSFLALQGPISSLSLDILPLVVVRDAHSRTIENALVLKDPHRNALVTPDDQSWVTNNADALLGQTENATQPPENAAEDLQELLEIMVPNKRRQWVKQHWSGIRILQSDNTSERFEKRLKYFFKQGNCTVRFFQTWISPAEIYGSRELHCLESVFKHHPDACVVIVSRTLDSDQGGRILRPFLNHGFKVLSASPDIPFLFNGTPAQAWLKNLKKGRVDPGEISFKQNLSNILRLVILYKFGGIYLDTDILVLKSFSSFSNVIGAQSEDNNTGRWYRLNNAVLIFDKQHPVLHDFIKEFAYTYNGSKWGHNGPYLATRVLMRQVKSGVKCAVVGTRYFYPVSWNHIPRLFRKPKGLKEKHWKMVKVEWLKNESYSVHLWNRETKGLEVEKGSVIDELFRSECVICEDRKVALE